MSYILDALRRADAERRQGQVPGLHASPAAAAVTEPRQRLVRAAVLLALVLLVVVLGLLWWWPAKTPALPTPAAVAVPSTPVPIASAAAPAPLPIVVSAAPAVPVPAPALSPVAPVAPTTPSAPMAQRPAPARQVALAALPPEERRQLPPLVAGGSVWSDSAASRFVILDGQVLREGDTVAPGVVLERIERRSAVLRWKDQRIEVPI